MDAFFRLEAAARELRSLASLDELAGWDAETYLPAKAAAIRGEQRAVLKTIIHHRLVGPELGELLENVGAGDGLDERQQALLAVLRRDRERESKIPARLVADLANAQAAGVEAWKQAKQESRFAVFQPHLEHLLKLRLEEADARGHTGERYDPLLDGNEPGMTTARLTPVLARLRDGLVPIVRALAERPKADDAFLRLDAWDPAAQLAFSREIIAAMGFDLDAGRLDLSAHPFCSGFAPTDVRLTTRVFRNDGSNALFSALHEAGHGLYEQGLPLDGTPLAQAASMGLHESQSRLWENMLGRSRAFWTHFHPKLAAHFPLPMQGISLDGWLGAINRVEPSLIRVDADEVTYNLHILVRFELELALVHGDLAVADLPAAWNEKYASILGVRPPDDARGVLQDIHWSFGEFGYFPTYAIGNMYSATLLGAAERALPTLWSDAAQGGLLGLREWLRTNIHSHGRAKPAEEIVRDVTGSGLTERDLLAYLARKYEV
jgi:carboxypeptidase Taq